jgi:hypothetical protein
MRRAAAIGAVLAVTLVAAETAAADHFFRSDEDVWVTRVTNPPDVIGIGAKMRAGDTTTNRGESTLPASVNRYYLSRDTHSIRGDRLLGRRAVGRLAPGRSSRGSGIFTVPRVRPGSYYVIACGRGGCRASTRTVAIKRSVAPEAFWNNFEVYVYRAGDPPRPIAPTLTVSDADDTMLSGATVSVVEREQLEALHYAEQLGITGTYNSGTGVLTLKGLASTASYQQALRSVGYSHNGPNPSPRRTLGLRVRDAVGVESTAVFTSIDVTVN